MPALSASQLIKRFETLQQDEDGKDYFVAELVGYDDEEQECWDDANALQNLRDRVPNLYSIQRLTRNGAKVVVRCLINEQGQRDRIRRSAQLPPRNTSEVTALSEGWERQNAALERQLQEAWRELKEERAAHEKTKSALREEENKMGVESEMMGLARTALGVFAGKRFGEQATQLGNRILSRLPPEMAQHVAMVMADEMRKNEGLVVHGSDGSDDEAV